MKFTRRSVFILAVLLFIVTLFGFLTYSLIAPSGIFSGLPNDLKVLQTENSTEYTDLDGNSVDLKKFKGKPIVINSWATWIPFSQTELPLLGRLKEEYGDTLTIIAMNRMENSGIIKSYINTFSISSSIIFLSDPTDNFYKAIEGYAMPETMIYDSEGNIVAHIRGVLNESEMKSYIASMFMDN